MKVLFAVSNENISNQIVKRYQKQYKEVVSYKNMYYFNAIIKELQRDKSYDRIVIGEDLEPFTNNNYDEIDKFIFEKLDNISDEASGINGEDIPIILISSERRTKSEPILVKLFGIGIYNVLLGQDRNVNSICELLNKPRGKKEAKIYYKIESDDVKYKPESEENVSEIEIKNILNHYKILGKDEDRYIESFNNIAAQYNDAQLRIISKFLPLNVKAVLEAHSPKYQSIMTFGNTASNLNVMQQKKENDGLKIGFLNQTNTKKMTKPVIVPTSVKKVATKKVIVDTNITPTENITVKKETIFKEIDKVEEISKVERPVTQTIVQKQEPIIETKKRGRGRPKKKENVIQEIIDEQPKRGRGRPKKEIPSVLNNIDNKLILDEDDEDVLPGLNNEEISSNSLNMNNIENNDTLLPGLEENKDTVLPGFDEIEDDDAILPGFDEVEDDNTLLPGFDEINDEDDSVLPGIDGKGYNNGFSNNSPIRDNQDLNYGVQKPVNSIVNYNSNFNYNNLSSLLSQDKKIVSFVGTTKNGTSFLVNNVAKCLSTMGIKTAILDLTSNKSSYYIYTKNEEQLRNIAYESIKNLSNGIANGIQVDKYLDVYTALPGDSTQIENLDTIISTLVQKYSVILMDCDFNTRAEFFGISQEIYIVQSMDILTIQPMTAFLRDLKAKDILKQEKIRIVINKEMRIRGLSAKVIIGGLAFYNDPAMSFMTDLFNKEIVKYCTIPFDIEAYSKYLEGVMNCEISINYSKNFMTNLRQLANMVYPLLGNKYKPMGDNRFSSNMNNTLEQMKRKY